MSGPRIALLGFSIECNRFAPVCGRDAFEARVYLHGDGVLKDARHATPRLSAELPGFLADMDEAGPWLPLPTLFASAEPNGPVDQPVFDRFMAQWEERLTACLPVDGVYLELHGAALATDDHDPEGTLLAMVRRVVGPAVPVVATFDLHANVSARMVANLDAFVGYRTNPHMDMRACGAEAAQHLRRLVGGQHAHLARVRLPIVPPTVSLLTGADAALRPYGEVIDLGQTRMRQAPYAGVVWNVSVMGGFAFADTPFNGLTVVVTATDAGAARDLAAELARECWDRRAAFDARLTALEDAAAMARQSPPCIFADVADNPGGGGRGNTMWILEAFRAAGARGALFGVIHDPLLAAEAHALGVGAVFQARFNRAAADDFARLLTADATVAFLHPGPMVGRRGIRAGTRFDLGPSAALDLDGNTVVVVSNRTQCCDPVMFEAFGLDIAAASAVVVKSRGHFRGGFDQFFPPDRVIEVDAPGLTSPVLSRFAWRHLPRPVLPLDPDTDWAPQD